MLVLGAMSTCVAQAPDGPRTLVTPLPGEDILGPCEYRIFVADPSHPVRAAWIIFERGRDSLNWYRDREVRGFAREFNLALVLAMHCRSKERDDMNVEPTKGVGRALFTALDQFAELERRPELGSVPVILLGWSGAGSLTGRMAAYRPARYLAGIAYAPGQYEPLGMDTIALSPQALRAPQLVIANGADSVNGTERPYGYFKRYFDQGAPWTFVVQNRTPHCCLRNAESLILEWLRGVLAGNLEKRGAGAFGYITPEFSEVRDEWKQPVFNVRSARVAQSPADAKKDELSAGWLPSSGFAVEWLNFERRPRPAAVWDP
jgi:dienelactone hydrolase